MSETKARWWKWRPANRRRRGRHRLLLLTSLALVLGAVAVPSTPAPLAAAGTVELRAEFSVRDLVRAALGPVDAVTYVIRTTLGRPQGEVVREHTGLVQVSPLGLRADVANRVDVGDGDSAADVDADVWVDPRNLDQIEIDVRRVGTALPLRVELVLDLPDGENGARFGYDASATGHPKRLTTLVSFRGSATASTVDARASFTEAVGPLTVLAELFGKRDDGTAFDPATAAVTLDPVPATLGLGVDSDSLAGTTVVDLSAAAPTVAVAAITDVKGERTRTLDATIDQVPTQTTVTATSDPVARTVNVVYGASAPIAVVDATATDTVESGPDVALAARAEQVPANFSVDTATTSADVDGVPTDTTTVTYGADARLGRLDATLTIVGTSGDTNTVSADLADLPTSVTATLQTRGLDDELTDPDERARVVDVALASTVGDPVIGRAELGFADASEVTVLDPAPFFDDGELAGGEEAGYVFDADTSVATRLSGLRAVHLELGEPVLVGEELQRPIEVHLEAARQPFLVHQRVDGERLDATILRTPPVIDLSYDVDPNGDFTAGYSSTAPIERSELFVSIPRDGELDPKTVDVHIDGIPAALSVTRVGALLTATVPDDPGTPTVEAVGRIEALLNGNPVASPLPASDGTLELHISPEAKRLAADEDGVVLDVFDADTSDVAEDVRTTVHARATGVTGFQFSEEKALEDIDAPDDRSSFQEGSPRPVGEVPTIAAQALTTTVVARIEQAPAADGETQDPFGVRLFDSTGVEATYVETRLDSPADDVAVTFVTQRKRIDNARDCDPSTGEGCGQFARSCSLPGTFYCEDVLMIDHHSSAPSGTLTLNTNSGERENLFVTTPSLPNDVEVCIATDGTCTDHAAGFAVTALSMRLMASTALTALEIRDCVEEAPGDEAGVCARNGVGLDDEAVFGDDDNQYVSGVLDSVRFLELEASPPPADDRPVGHLYVNTTGRRFEPDPATGRDPDPSGEHAVEGILKIRKLSRDPSCDDPGDDGSLKRMRLRFHTVSADQRVMPMLLSGGCVLVTGVSVPKAGESGTMTCRAGTEFDLAPNLDVGVDVGELRNEICTIIGA